MTRTRHACLSRLSLRRFSLRRALLLLPALGLFVLAGSCGDFFVSDSSIQSITVTPSAAILKAGDNPPDTITLAASATTVGGTPKDDTANAHWNTSNSAVVTVEKGVVTAVGSSAGKAVVTAKDGGVTSNNVNVLTYIVPTPANLFITADGITSGGVANPGTFQFHAFLGPDATFPDVTQFVTWSSNPTTAATVNAQTGLVTVLTLSTPTTVTITATANVGASAPATPSTISGTFQFTAD